MALADTVSKTTILDVSALALDVALTESFGIATGTQDVARNVLVTVTLASGQTGLGEAAPFPAVSGETQRETLAGLETAASALRGLDVARWRHVAAAAREALAPELKSALCAVETAVLDAFSRHHGVSLWHLFGGRTPALDTDITLVTGSVEATREAAARASAAGFRRLKIKIGGASTAHDLARLEAVAIAAPDATWTLDGNTAMSPEALRDLLTGLKALRARIALLEQPSAAGDLEALHRIRMETGLLVAADESARSAVDVAAIAAAGAADVINVKIMKSGIAETLEMIDVARAHGLGLMVGGMVESAMAMSTSACIAAGVGGFAHVDLDTPLFLRDSPVRGGFDQRGPAIRVDAIPAGHGCWVAPRATGT